MLFGLSLEAAPGKAVLVSGDTGAGRSSLLHVLHLDAPAGGGSVQFGCGAPRRWLPFHPTTSDRCDLQRHMGCLTPASCAIFFASVQVKGGGLACVGWPGVRVACGAVHGGTCTCPAPSPPPALPPCQPLPTPAFPGLTPPQENLVCGAQGSDMPSVADCQEAAELTGLDADVRRLPDGFQSLVGEASRLELTPTARLRLGLARLLLLGSPPPRLVLIDDADRFLTASPRLPGGLGGWVASVGGWVAGACGGGCCSDCVAPGLACLNVLAAPPPFPARR